MQELFSPLFRHTWRRRPARTEFNLMNLGVRSLRSALAWGIFCAFLAYLSLYPFQWRGAAWDLSLARLHWANPRTRGDWMDVVANVICYLPTGFFAWAAISSLRIAALQAVLFSFFIEFFQSGLAQRDPSWRDVACNGLGGYLGAVAAIGLQRSALIGLRFQVPPELAFFALCWIAWINYPFVPALRLGQVNQALRAFWVLQPFTGLAEIFLGAFAVSALLRIYAAPLILQVALLACLPLRVVIFGLSLSADYLCAAFAAWLIAQRLFNAEEQQSLKAGCGLGFLAWITFSQLQPFHFQSPAAPMNWLPFGPLIESTRGAAVPILARKLLLYSTPIWMLSKGWNSLGKATALVTFVLAVTELVQPYLPGRTPESTDPVLALAAGLFFAVYSRPRNLLQ